MWVEILLLVLIGASAAVGWHVVRRPESGPASYWVAGWLAAGVAVILVHVRDAFPWVHLISFPFGTLFAALMLAGAFVLASRPVPRWLLPAALAYGAARSAFAASGREELAYAAALAVDPFLVLAAAWVVYRATPREGAGRSQRALAPSLAVLSLLGSVHVVWLLRAGFVPPGLFALWVVAVPPLFGVQIHAEWVRGRRLLQRARDALEERVAERTAELARANESLRKSEERWRVISELGSDLAFGFRVDLADHVYDGWVTDAYSRITGYALDELKGAGWLSLVHPEDLARARRQFEEIRAGRSRELELRLVTKAGACVSVHARLDVSSDPVDGSWCVTGAARDVTEARRAEEERRELERQVLESERIESLAMLTGGVAHDFNNLLAVILGNSRMALAEAAPGSPLHSRLARIGAAAEHGARLTEQMLAYSGKTGVALKPLDLSRLIEEMSDLLRASVSERCALEFDLAPRAAVEGDGTQLRQVVINLVTNASEALADGVGKLFVRTGLVEQDARALAGAAGAKDPRPGRYAFVEVADDGQGMDAATKARIFEPFFTTKFSGRGLGLAGVLGIVRAHRGVVRVESEVGRGTSVRVLLPEPYSAVADPAPPAHEPQARRGTILVVDDQSYVVEIAQAFLERAGHRVLTASGGRAAIECFRERGHQIDAVLLDLAMPDANGEQVLLELQRLRPDVRVIIATGYTDEARSERLASQGVAGFVHKPYEPEAILEQVDRALARPGVPPGPGSGC